ncbi:MAG: cellobiohydrolase [Glaciihabitans sp.]|nr:cellobiohydrolase [Glaciihabitans sp.]
MSSAPSRTFRLRLSILAAVVILAIATLWVVNDVIPSISRSNPFAGQTLYTYPDSTAATAQSTSTDPDDLSPIVDTPAAIWLLPEAHPVARIADFVDSVARDAEAKGQLPVFVVYGIPGRDCSSESAGGLSDADYPSWVSEIGVGLLNHQSIVILEPDALALAPGCGDVDARTAQLRDAATRLVTTNLLISAPTPHVYIDAGHSDWLDAPTMAAMLNSSGINEVAGFSTNVSNFNSTSDEVAYGQKVSALTGGAHFVVDTSRNGNGSNGDWCNPSGRALGDIPGAVTDTTSHVANLWIKNPGESDGRCNGGPAAGQWWNDGALALIRG